MTLARVLLAERICSIFEPTSERGRKCLRVLKLRLKLKDEIKFIHPKNVYTRQKLAFFLFPSFFSFSFFLSFFPSSLSSSHLCFSFSFFLSWFLVFFLFLSFWCYTQWEAKSWECEQYILVIQKSRWTTYFSASKFNDCPGHDLLHLSLNF